MERDRDVEPFGSTKLQSSFGRRSRPAGVSRRTRRRINPDRDQLRAFRPASGFFDRSGDLADGQEHGDRLGPIAESATDQLDRKKSQRRIESDRIRFGIHDYSNATNAVSHVQSKFKHGAQQQSADAMSLVALVYCKAGQSQDGQWISGEATTQVLAQLFCNQLSAGDGDKTCNLVPMDGDIACSNMVSNLILARVLLEEAIEIDVPAAKSASVVPGFQPPDANFERCITHGTVLSALPSAGLPG